jgi:hypothetical protein
MDQWVTCTYTLSEACESRMGEFYPSSKCGAKNCMRQKKHKDDKVKAHCNEPIMVHEKSITFAIPLRCPSHDSQP